jgi:gamma-glutamylcyclotransferase (GGCT)/AIG2-like uncharacterized protein YtfP
MIPLMAWWQSLQALGGLNEVMGHLRSSRVRPWSVINRCQDTFAALDAAQLAFERFEAAGDSADEEAGLARMLEREFRPEPVMLLHNNHVRRLAAFQPGGHEVASSIHHLAAGLRAVRSAVTPPDGTAYPIRLEDSIKNAEVCAAALPVLDLIVDGLFGGPDARLAAYGTLRPGEVNHHLLKDVRGVWTSGHVEGRLAVRDGFPACWWRPGEGRVPVEVLAAAALPGLWAGLDAFEGQDYPRILVPVVEPGGSLVIANLYERYP